MTTRRQFLSAAVAAVPSIHPAAGANSAAAPATSRPNLLVMVSDQQHWQALGLQDRFFDTPNQDRLGSTSAVFDYAFCSTPQCSPSRSSIFTGFYPSRTGVYGNIGALGGNHLRMTTIGARLKAAGYNTAFFGKWHLGDDPNANAGWNEEWKKQDDREVTRRALDFLHRNKGAREPFALFLCYLDPHDIYHFHPDRNKASAAGSPLSQSWEKETFAGKPAIQKQFMTADQGKLIWGRDRKAWEAYREFYKGKVRLYDNAVGEVLRALDSEGMADSTVVISTSDHGDMDTNHKLIFKGPFMYEHMVRVPLIVRVPRAFGGRGPQRITDFDAVNVDLTPTLADFAGLPPEPSHGVSLRPLLTGGKMANRDYVIGQYYGKQNWVNPIRMLRTRRYKYNVIIGAGAELYDLRNDPEELHNLANDSGYAKVAKELNRELEAWMRDHADPFHTFRAVPKST